MLSNVQLCSPVSCSLIGFSVWNFPSKNTGSSCHSLHEGLFLTQGFNLGLMSSALADGFFLTSATWEALLIGSSCALEKKRMLCSKLPPVSSVAQSCLTVCNHMDCSIPGLPVHHQLPEFTQTHVHWVGDAIQPSHPLSSPSPAFNLSQHQGLFQWDGSLH